MRSRSFDNWIAVGVLASLASVAEAVPVAAISISNQTGSTTGTTPVTFGWSFTTTGDLLVMQLGLFDSGSDGLVDEHAIGIWNSGGTLVASGNVGSGSSVTLVDRFRYVDIADILLPTGTYTIGALFLTGNDPLIFRSGATGFASAPFITFAGNRFGFGPGLGLPTLTTGTDPSYFGPNFIRRTGGGSRTGFARPDRLGACRLRRAASPAAVTCLERRSGTTGRACRRQRRAAPPAGAAPQAEPG
jgi:hypothetical protein